MNHRCFEGMASWLFHCRHYRERKGARYLRALFESRHRAVLLLVLVALVPAIAAPQQDIVPLLQAQLIDRFTQLTEWPASSNVSNTAVPFVIGVIGMSDIHPALETLAGESKIKGKKIKVRVINQLTEIDNCQILFIAGTEKSRLSEILGSTRGKPILTIGDTKGFAKDGVMINFSTKGQTIQFMVNNQSAGAVGIRFSDKLLALGELVE